MLTSIYAALFKTTSPLLFDWRRAEISEMLGGDRELVQSFSNITTEMHWFRVYLPCLHKNSKLLSSADGARDQLLDDDALFKALIFDNELKLARARKKAAVRAGLLWF